MKQFVSSYLQYTGYRVERLTPSTLNAVITTTILTSLLVSAKVRIDLIVYQFMIYFTTLFGIKKVLFLSRYMEVFIRQCQLNKIKCIIGV